MQRAVGKNESSWSKGLVKFPRGDQFVIGVPNVKLNQFVHDMLEDGTSVVRVKVGVVILAKCDFGILFV